MADKIDFGTSGYVLGIVSIILGVLQPVAGLIIGIVGINLSKKEKGDLARRGKKMSKIGIIVSIIFLLIYLGLVVLGTQYGLSNIPVA